MLNEYKEYQLLLTEGYGELLRRDNLKNKLSGLRPVLTIIARGFLELCAKEGITDIAEKSSACDNFLKCWLMGEYKKQPFYSEKVCAEFEKAKKASLIKYIIKEKMNIRGLKCCDKDTVTKYLNDKIDLWENSMFYSLNENSVNEIYFKVIIADALNKGKLTNQKLVIKNNLPLYGVFCSLQATEQINTLLAAVAVCLQYLPKGQYCSIAKLVQISNYINKPTAQKNKRASALSSVAGFVEEELFNYNGSPVIRKTTLTSGVVKFVLNRSWLEDFDVKLIDNNQQTEEGYIAFSDHDLFPERF